MKFGPPSSERIRVFDLTPMIDGVFQLIIFFMFTAQFGQLTRSAIDLPREGGERDAAPEKPSIVIDIDEAGRLLVLSEPTSIDAIAAMLDAEIQRAGGPDGVSVQVRADRLGRAALLNEVTRRAAELGVTRWSIATIDPGEGAP